MRRRIRAARSMNGEEVHLVLPAISKQALKKIGSEVRRWRIHRRFRSPCVHSAWQAGWQGWRVMGDCHAGICEGLEVRSLPATRPHCEIHAIRALSDILDRCLKLTRDPSLL